MALKRKFYKLDGLHNIFQLTTDGDKQVYDTSVAGFTPSEEYGVSQVDEHTILFITCSTEDAGKYVRVFAKDLSDPNDVQLTQQEYLISLGDTMIWSRGAIYSISQSKSVSDVTYDGNIVISYSDGTTQTISAQAMGSYDALSPLYITGGTGGSQIGIKSHKFENNNFIEGDFTEGNLPNSISNNTIKYAHVEGYGNIGSTSFQHTQGKFAQKDTESIFIIGNGNNINERSNIFTVGFDGKAHSVVDVTAGPNKNIPLYKLSDIHSVVNDDWAFYE